MNKTASKILSKTLGRDFKEQSEKEVPLKLKLKEKNESYKTTETPEIKK